MTVPSAAYDVTILGGGLAGLMAAIRAEEAGLSTVLVDAGVPGPGSGLGGFAPFSGAKFSMFPAGSGIVPLVGSEAGLIEGYSRMCRYFAALGFEQFELEPAQVAGEQSPAGSGLDYRRYHSVLLSPTEMTRFLTALAGRLTRTRVVRAAATALDLGTGSAFGVRLLDGTTIRGDALIVAAGRLGAGLLAAAGVPETEGKGIDVGVRLEFDERTSLAALRALGPDAKFMADGVRTFCLNSPGRIFHYPGSGFSLPGGVVAEPDWGRSNVGILCRLKDRTGTLARLAACAPAPGSAPLAQPGSSRDLGWTADSRTLLGAAAGLIDAFVARLEDSGAVTLPSRYVVHYPLLDWHWPVFSTQERLGTAVEGVLATGDASGHARGLMQAALTGVLAVEEILN